MLCASLSAHTHTWMSTHNHTHGCCVQTMYTHGRSHITTHMMCSVQTMYITYDRTCFYIVISCAASAVFFFAIIAAIVAGRNRFILWWVRVRKSVTESCYSQGVMWSQLCTGGACSRPNSHVYVAQSAASHRVRLTDTLCNTHCKGIIHVGLI
jgi:hypothetical protein